MVSFQGLRAAESPMRNNRAGVVTEVAAGSLLRGRSAAAGVVRCIAAGAGATAASSNGSNGSAVSTSTSSSPRGGRNHSGMNVVFISAEVSPWSKTGGLGDVLGGLPPALAARGHRVMTVSPRYDQYKDAWDTNTPLEITIGNRTETVNFFHTHKRGVDRIFIDHPLFLAKVWGKTGGKIYGPTSGEDYDDNQFRFMLLAKAAIEAARVLNLDSNEFFSGPYGENVVFVANDWHTALLPCYLKTEYKAAGLFQSAKVAFCVHNIAYQGRFAFADFERLGLPDSFRSSFDFIDGYAKPVKGRKINWMKAGFLESDLNITVSPNYAAELVSGEDTGVELDSIVRKTGIKGIVNGMDVQEWDPSADKYLDTPYDINTVFEAKPALKEALQAEVGLPIRPDVPLFGFIGRLEEQKGSDILAEAVKDFLKEDIQLIVLGTGKKYLERQLEELDTKFPGKAVGVVKFNTPLAHMITAGADFMLVPSRFEPCGLIQLHAMRYGTPAVCASTGGLVDTVEDGVTGFQVGKPFNVDCEKVDPEDVALLSATVKKAVEVYGTPKLKTMIRACMAQDLSWKGPAREWEETLLGLQVEGSGPGQEGEEIAPKAKANVAAP
jgi:granule-bound starch synthase